MPREKPALEKVEVAYAAYIAERDKSVGRDEAKLKQLEKAWKDAIAEADKYVVSNAFGKIVEQNGGEDMNAFTSLRRDRISLFSAGESSRTVGLPRVRALPASRAARVLQGAQRGDRRAPHAHRQQSLRTPARAVHRSGLHGSSLSPANRRLDVRPESLSPPPTRRSSSTSITFLRTWWWPLRET